MSHKLRAAVLEVAKQNEVAVGAGGPQSGHGGGLRGVSFSERLEGETLPLPLYYRVQTGEFPSRCEQQGLGLFCKWKIRVITSGGPLCISANCTKWNPCFYCTVGRQTLQDLPPSGGEVRLWMSELWRACSSSCPVPSSSMEPSLGQGLSRPLPRTGADKNVTATGKVSCDRQWLPTGLTQLPRVSLLLGFCFSFPRD